MDGVHLMPRPWTNAEQKLLAKYRQQGMSLPEIAELLDRTPASVKSRANKLRIVTGRSRSWTAADLALLQAAYGTMKAADLARELGRTERSIHMQANTQGWQTRRSQRGDSFLAFIRQQHSLGWSDAEIANAWNADNPASTLSREQLANYRRRLGLPSNAYSPHRRQRVAAKTAEYCRQSGVKNLAEVRSQAYRQFAARQGWPADLRPRAVQILTLLYEQGPQTRRQICAAIGMTWKGSRKSLVSNDPGGSYLAHLVARGLVVVLPKQLRTGNGQGSNVNIYACSPQVQRNLG